MRVLLPIYVDQVFPREQAQGLREHCEVETSFEAFWENRGRFDIVQLNWPEELTQWREPTDLELILLRRVLQEWGKTARIVVTRHNFHPHYADTEKYRKLYEIVYLAAHAVIHMGEFSRREYCQRYVGMEFLQNQIQEVIPHPVFSSYPDTLDRHSARRSLGVGPDTFVLLAFGRVQSAAEKNIVVDAFLGIPTRDKIAIVPGWKRAAAKEPVNRIKWARVRASGRFRCENRFVPDEDVGALFRAADLCVIPRVNTLNSGIVSLCIRFDCQMIAPDCGNIREQAVSMECGVFDQGNNLSLKVAIEKLVLSERKNRTSYERLRKCLESARIAKRNFGLYERIILEKGNARANDNPD